MTVKTGAQSLLVEEVGNQTNAAAEDEETVQDPHLEVLFGLLGAESTAVPQQIDETNGHAAVNVQDQVIFLGCCDRLNGNGVVEEFVRGKVLDNKLLNELNTKVGVVSRLDPMADARD